VDTYVVGGAVRDELLGLPVHDRDHVVVGATPEDMTRQGFRPVGKDFPVFLHPVTKEEYALARTERKSGRGYKGFQVHASPEVTLEEDLKRRDLTINAMARAGDGSLIDPFGGSKDLKAGILRHVSEAFAEDPVRILRVARFAARFGFKVAQETMALMREMVRSGETDHLVPERVWQEFSKGLGEKHPEAMFAVLKECGLYEKLLPELTELPSKLAGSVPMRFALLMWPLTRQQISSLSERLRVPNDARDLAMATSASRNFLESAHTATAARLLELLTVGDAFRRPERFAELLQVARLAAPGIDTARVERALRAVQEVDEEAIAKTASSTQKIPELIKQARVNAIEKGAPG
jgi:tRNA nucleotidyltransferase (CCA-adding enzyme)